MRPGLVDIGGSRLILSGCLPILRLVGKFEFFRPRKSDFANHSKKQLTTLMPSDRVKFSAPFEV